LGEILLAEDTPRQIIGVIEGYAACVGALGDLPARVAPISNRAAIRRNLLDDFAEAISDVGRGQRARVLIGRDGVDAVARQIDGGAVFVGLADQPVQRVEVSSFFKPSAPSIK
jgi:hypothetical protein